MIETIHQIVSITDEEELLKQFYEFESSLDERIRPLRDKLAQQILSPEVLNMEIHMTYVESWRDRVSQFLRLVEAFVEHTKSSHFMLVKTKGVNAEDRTAYQKKLTAGMVATECDLDRLIDSVDSRVNLCKKLLGIEGDIGGRRTATRS